MTTRFEKLVEAIHYIYDKASDNPEKLDQIKLNKVLWYSDAQAYLARGGVPITGDVYIKKPFGPVARRNRVAVERLERAGALRRGRSASGSGFWNTHFDIIEGFQGTALSADEIEILDAVYRSIVEGGDSSMDVSEGTHGQIWQLAANGEELPLFTVFAERLGEVSPEQMELAREGL